MMTDKLAILLIAWMPLLVLVLGLLYWACKKGFRW